MHCQQWGADKWKDAAGQDIGQAFSKAGIITKFGNANAVFSNARFSVSTAEMARITLANIDKFIEYVDSNRAELGAIQNRMESTIRNQSSIAENESDARGRIRDTDFASETAALTQNQIIQQASQTILSQANQRPTVALSLFRAVVSRLKPNNLSYLLRPLTFLCGLIYLSSLGSTGSFMASLENRFCLVTCTRFGLSAVLLIFN